MKETSITNFGLLIAFLLPGFVALWAVSLVNVTVASWFGVPPDESPSVGGFLYVTLASVLAGLTVSTVRWLVIDTLHHAMGIARPTWDFSRLQQNIAAFDMLIEIHYRYYQFYANMVVAIVFAFVMRRVEQPLQWPDGIDLMMAVGTVVFFAGSRDTLTKYYERVGQLLRPPRSRQAASRKKVAQADPIELAELG